MDLPQKVLADIAQITREIEEKYPELQKYLDELPMTLSDNENKVKTMDEEALKEYLQSLKSIVKKYKKQHQ